MPSKMKMIFGYTRELSLSFTFFLSFFCAYRTKAYGRKHKRINDFTTEQANKSCWRHRKFLRRKLKDSSKFLRFLHLKFSLFYVVTSCNIIKNCTRLFKHSIHSPLCGILSFLTSSI